LTVTTDTQRARLERAFEMLKNQNITPILKLTGSTGVVENDLADFKAIAWATCEPNSWVGAHVGAEEHGGGYWDRETGQLRFRHDDSLVQELWFSFPLDRGDIAIDLLQALEANAFYVSWFGYNDAGEVTGPGTDADCVRLVLTEED
jgi:hypothetical protein